MRRLVAIFLTLWTCVLAPALPLAAAACEKVAACACCHCPGSDCGSRDCAPPPATARASSVVADPASSVRVAPARLAARAMALPAFARFVVPTARPAPLCLTPERVAPASAPVFAEHCCRLL